MNNEVKKHEKSEFKGVRHNAIWFGLPSMIVFNAFCLIFTAGRADLSGLHAYTWIAVVFSAFFFICLLFKDIKFKEYTAAGWFYAAIEGITYLTCYIYSISLFFNIFTSFDFTNLWALIVIGVFYNAFQINNIINTAKTPMKLRAAKIEYMKEA